MERDQILGDSDPRAFLPRRIPIVTVSFSKIAFTQNTNPVRILTPLFLTHGSQVAVLLHISPSPRASSDESPGFARTAVQHNRDSSLPNVGDDVTLADRRPLYNGGCGW